MKSKSLIAEIGALGMAVSMCTAVSAQESAVTATKTDTNKAVPSAVSNDKESAAEAISSGNALQVVTVTAQKRSEAINSVGLPMVAKTGGQLRDEGVKSASDMGEITPGLTVTETAPTGVPVYTLRGVGFADFATASSSTVGLYADEVAIPYAVMSTGTLFDLERVEILKGPQGDLYGRNTTAGQINFIEAKPTRTQQSGLIADYSRFNVVDLEGFTSGAISDNLLGRLAIKTTQTIGNDGWQQSITRPGDQLGKKNADGARGLLNWIINEDATLLLNFHWNQDKSDNVAPTAYDGTLTGNPSSQFLPTAYPVAPFFSTGNNRLADWSDSFRPVKNDRLSGGSAKLDWDVSDYINFTSITAYDKFVRADQFETEGVSFQAGNTKNKSNIGVFSQELRLTSNDKLPVSWIGGLYYSRDTISEDYDFFFKDSYYGLPPLGINDIATHYDQTTTSNAAFGHVEWKFADQFKFIVGTRYTAEKRSWTGCTYDTGDGTLAGAWNNILTPYTIVANGFPYPGPATAGGCAVYDDIVGSPNFGKFAPYSDEITTNKWQGKVGLNYTPGQDYLLYANVSKGFKSGGFNGASAQTQSQLIPYRPEELTDYEIGLKSALLNHRVQFNASAFYYDYRDKQEQTIAVTPVGNIGGLTNVPKSKVEGVELQLNALVTTGLTENLSVAYLDTRILDYTAISPLSAYPTVLTYDASGFRLPNSPRWQATSTTTYEWTLSNAMKMSVAGDVNFKANTFGSTQPEIPEYTLFNARLGLSDPAKNWTLSLYGRNLGNKYYWSAAFSGNATYARINGLPTIYGIMFAQKF